MFKSGVEGRQRRLAVLRQQLLHRPKNPRRKCAGEDLAGDDVDGRMLAAAADVDVGTAMPLGRVNRGRSRRPWPSAGSSVLVSLMALHEACSDEKARRKPWRASYSIVLSVVTRAVKASRWRPSPGLDSAGASDIGLDQPRPVRRPPPLARLAQGDVEAHDDGS